MFVLSDALDPLTPIVLLVCTPFWRSSTTTDERSPSASETVQFTLKLAQPPFETFVTLKLSMVGAVDPVDPESVVTEIVFKAFDSLPALSTAVT